MLPKGERKPVQDYTGNKQAMTPDKGQDGRGGMNVTGDSFADSIMSNHY